LEKTKSSIRINKNPESKIIKKELADAKIKEAESLRLLLKEALTEKGYTDLPTVFKKFDTDGNGYFSQIELECAFTILGIQFGKEQLRRLIRISDKNKDGRISFTEFQRMVETSA
jgi:Ca2+-binding EF-hand superfamily protein